MLLIETTKYIHGLIVKLIVLRCQGLKYWDGNYFSDPEKGGCVTKIKVWFRQLKIIFYKMKNLLILHEKLWKHQSLSSNVTV